MAYVQLLISSQSNEITGMLEGLKIWGRRESNNVVGIACPLRQIYHEMNTVSTFIQVFNLSSLLQLPMLLYCFQTLNR